MGVTVAAVVGLTRLFSDGEFLVPVVAAALASHVVAAACRRMGMHPALAAFVSGIGLVLFVTWVVEPHTATMGLIPGPDTWRGVGADLRDAFAKFGEVKAPVATTRGFVLTCVVGTWMAAWLADLFAFRMRARFEALVPSFTIFLFGAMLGTDRHRVAVAALYLAAILAFVVLADLSAKAASTTWFGDRTADGQGAVLRGAVVVAVVAVAVGARRRAAAARRRVGRSVRAGRPCRRVELAPRHRQPAGRHPGPPRRPVRPRGVRRGQPRAVVLAPDLAGELRRQHLVVAGHLPAGRRAPSTPTSCPAAPPTRCARSSPWGRCRRSGCRPPSARRRSTTRVPGMRYEQGSASLLTDEATGDGLRYTVESEVPRFTEEELATAPGGAPPDVAERYLGLPGDLPGRGRGPGAGGDGRPDDCVRQGPGPAGLVPPRTSPTRSPSRPATATTPSSGSCRTGRGTASSSPAPTRRWPGRSGCPPGSPSASPRGPSTRAGCSTSRASRPTPGPRSTWPATAGCCSSPPRAARLREATTPARRPAAVASTGTAPEPASPDTTAPSSESPSTAPPTTAAPTPGEPPGRGQPVCDPGPIGTLANVILGIVGVKYRICLDGWLAGPIVDALSIVLLVLLLGVWSPPSRWPGGSGASGGGRRPRRRPSGCWWRGTRPRRTWASPGWAASATRRRRSTPGGSDRWPAPTWPSRWSGWPPAPRRRRGRMGASRPEVATQAAVAPTAIASALRAGVSPLRRARWALDPRPLLRRRPRQGR